MTQTTTTAPVLSSDARKALEGCPVYQQCPAVYRPLLVQDMAAVLADGLDVDEYLESLAEYTGNGCTVAQYLAENWDLGPDGALVQRTSTEGEERGEDGLTPSYRATVARFTALVPQIALDAQQPSSPEPGKADTDAERAAAELQAKQQAAEQAEEEAREAAAATLKALVKAYARGEKAYRDGLLEAGRLSWEYIRQRLGLGDKRQAAVQAIEGRLAEYASDSVDVNRLVRCYTAYSLLAGGTGLNARQGSKPAPADAVPYGHYRDAWCLLLERLHKDTAQETYTLLPGMEAECLAAFKAAVDNGLSKQASLDKCQGLVREYRSRLDKAAQQAKQRADTEAKQRAEQAEAARREQAKREAEAEAARKVAQEEGSEESARQALEAEQAAEQARRDKATADAAAQKAAAEKARAEREAKDHAEQKAAADRKAVKAAVKDAAKQGHSPGPDAIRVMPQDYAAAWCEHYKLATEGQSLEQLREALAKHLAPKAAPAPAPQAAPESKPTGTSQPAPKAKPSESQPDGGNLLRAAKHGTVKDVAEMCVELLVGGDEPDSVLEAVLHALDGHKELSKQSHRALKAALVVLASKPAVSAPVGGATVKVPEQPAA